MYLKKGKLTHTRHRQRHRRIAPRLNLVSLAKEYGRVTHAVHGHKDWPVLHVNRLRRGRCRVRGLGGLGYIALEHACQTHMAITSYAACMLLSPLQHCYKTFYAQHNYATDNDGTH